MSGKGGPAAAGVLVGVLMAWLGVLSPLGATPPGRLTAVHSPPALVVDGEVTDLSILIGCPWSSENEDRRRSVDHTCDLTVTLWLRDGRTGTFTPIDLEAKGDPWLRHYVVRGTERLDGSAYWFEVTDKSSGQKVTLPAEGAAHPFRLWVPDPEHMTRVALPLAEHEWKTTAETVAHLPWGSGESAVGLSVPPPGADGEIYGPQSLDVAPDGTVLLLDTVNRRALSIGHGRPPSVLVEGLSPASLDIAADASGALVLAAPGGRASIRSFGLDGTEESAIELPLEQRPTAITMTPAGVFAQSLATDMWMDLSSASQDKNSPGRNAAPVESPGRPVAGGASLVTRVAGDELRVAEIQGDRIIRWWSVTDPDGTMGPLMDVSVDNGVLTFVTFEAGENSDEFLAVRVDKSGALRSILLDAGGAVAVRTNRPIRIAGNAIYQMDPSSAGVDILRYDLGGSE
ncbi:MAG TPA: hypothetical protein ENK10_00420 [Acidobacteria bacterium]|nr:hypothetical protein [Acidobacteriota bacterium]